MKAKKGSMAFYIYYGILEKGPFYWQNRSIKVHWLYNSKGWLYDSKYYSFTLPN